MIHTLSLYLLLIASFLTTSSDIIFYAPLKINNSSVSEVDISCCHQQYILNLSLKLIEPLFSVIHIGTFT